MKPTFADRKGKFDVLKRIQSDNAKNKSKLWDWDDLYKALRENEVVYNAVLRGAVQARYKMYLYRLTSRRWW